MPSLGYFVDPSITFDNARYLELSLVRTSPPVPTAFDKERRMNSKPRLSIFGSQSLTMNADMIGIHYIVGNYTK